MYGVTFKPTCAMYLFHEKKFTYEHGNTSIPSLEIRQSGHETIARKGRPETRYNGGRFYSTEYRVQSFLYESPFDSL